MVAVNRLCVERVEVSTDIAPEGYTSCAAGRATAAHHLCVAVNSGWVRKFTSAVYGLLTVAGGSNDFCVSSSLYPWDVGASALMIQEAGGRVERLGTSDGSWDTIRDGVLLAWNGEGSLRDAVYDELTEERLAAISSV